VEKAGAGIFVSPGDSDALATAALQLASDEAKALKLGMSGREYVITHFDRRQLAMQFENTFIRLTECS
jgi:glycosyltransferase involved in cell wall biosynthesis